MWSEVQYLSRAHSTKLVARSVVVFAVACTVWAGGARADQGSEASQPASAPAAQADPCAERQAEARPACNTPRDGRLSGYSVSLDGATLTPFLRVTMGAKGALAFIARSRWLLTGDFQHHTTVGLECGMP